MYFIVKELKHIPWSGLWLSPMPLQQNSWRNHGYGMLCFQYDVNSLKSQEPHSIKFLQEVENKQDEHSEIINAKRIEVAKKI